MDKREEFTIAIYMVQIVSMLSYTARFIARSWSELSKILTQSNKVVW